MAVESKGEAHVTASGFIVYSPIADDAELQAQLQAVALDVRSDLGMRLAELGLSVEHGVVEIALDGFTGRSDVAA